MISADSSELGAACYNTTEQTFASSATAAPTSTGDDTVLNQASAPSQLKREFSVADEHVYDRSGPVRWIISHLLRYPHFLASFLLAATLTNVLFSAIPRLTGLAFDEVLKPEPSPGRLLTIALSIL